MNGFRDKIGMTPENTLYVVMNMITIYIVYMRLWGCVLESQGSTTVVKQHDPMQFGKERVHSVCFSPSLFIIKASQDRR